MIIPSRRWRFAATAALVGAVCGITAAIVVARDGLTLTHYDARGHLVVARRIVDSLTPGWQQIGAVWLPLPHVLNAVPVQLDSMFRSGLSAVVISVVSFTVAAGAIAWIASRLTESLWASTAALFTFVINPNLLYLQSTPLTEPLLLATTLLAVAMLIEWCAAGAPAKTHQLVGMVFALSCLTRYEGWPVTVTALAGAVWMRRRAGQTFDGAVREIAPVAVYPAAAIVAFLIFSRVVVGQWLVAGGFFVPENLALGDPGAAASQVLTGVRSLGGTITTVIAIVGLIGLMVRGLFSPAGAVAAIGLAPAAAAALPWFAFFQGHPHRVRYMVPLLAAQAIGVGVAAARWGRAVPAAAAVVMIIGALEILPMFGAAPITAEAQWDIPNAEARRQVTKCLTRQYDGTTIMASMDSLAHYLQELSRDGFQLRDFLHEGNGDIWLSAIERARPFAGWVLIDEYSEGGDMLAQRARENPRLLEGFARVCEGGGMALYRRQ